MPNFTPAPRRCPLWRLFIVTALLLVAAIAWSGFWFFAASQVDVRADAWREQEAKSGRVYDCAKRSVAGFPFRLEVRCDGASVSLLSQTAEQAATQAPTTARLGEILIVAQIYDPKLLIAEFTAPATIFDRGQPSMTVNWSKARSSVVGLPAIPQRASIVFEDPAIDRVTGSAPAQRAGAKHVELHGRLALEKLHHFGRGVQKGVDGLGIEEGARLALQVAARERRHAGERHPGADGDRRDDAVVDRYGSYQP